MYLGILICIFNWWYPSFCKICQKQSEIDNGTTQLAIACSKLTIETLEQRVKHVQS